MSADPAATTAEVGAPGYARLSRRLRAYLIDLIIFLSVMVAALIAASVVQSDGFSRTLGFVVVIGSLAYEPLLVSLTGGSIGHYLTNLRVVDSRTQGNLGLVKAAARMVLKTVLGWFSFITMATTRRHQAVHDLLTQSTVQIRDLAKAEPHHYASERLELASAAMPSRVRRLAVIAAYLLGASVLFAIASGVLMGSDTLSAACVASDRCAADETLWLNGLGLGWFAVSALCIIQGWRGRLLGCRVGAAPWAPHS